MKDRIMTWLDDLRCDYSDREIVASLGNGDIDKPDWISVSESIDHIKIWDNETTASAHLGFVWLDCDDEQEKD